MEKIFSGDINTFFLELMLFFYSYKDKWNLSEWIFKGVANAYICTSLIVTKYYVSNICCEKELVQNGLINKAHVPLKSFIHNHN